MPLFQVLQMVMVLLPQIQDIYGLKLQASGLTLALLLVQLDLQEPLVLQEPQVLAPLAQLA
jgi:hypothetical protein